MYPLLSTRVLGRHASFFCLSAFLFCNEATATYRASLLLSSCLKNLIIFLHLIEMYCKKYQVKLVGSKTDDQAAVELATTTIFVDKQAV